MMHAAKDWRAISPDRLDLVSTGDPSAAATITGTEDFEP